MFNFITSYKNLHILENVVAMKRALKTRSGIYCIRNLITGAVYVGSAMNLSVRLAEHLRGYNSNNPLQNSIRKNSLEQFEIGILEFCTSDILILTEQFFLNQLFTLDKSLRYNISPTAESCFGVSRSEDTCAKMSESKKGENNPMSGITGVNHPKYGLKGVKPSHSISVSVLNLNLNEVHSFSSQRDAAKFIGISHKTVQRAIRSGKVIKGQYKIKDLTQIKA